MITQRKKEKKATIFFTKIIWPVTISRKKNIYKKSSQNKVKQPDKKIKLRISFKWKRVHFFIKKSASVLNKEDHLVYEFNNRDKSCNTSSSYISYSTNALTRRLKNISYKGRLKDIYKKEKNGKELHFKTLLELLKERNNII